MDEADVTLPVPKPSVPASPDEPVTPAQAAELLAAGAGLFDTRPSTASRAWQPPAVEVLQKLLPQYEISAFIARGGMGAVYRGMQRALKRAVAIKVMPPEVEDGVGDMQFAARFKQEAQAMAQLSHPNIVAVFDAGEVSAPGGMLLYFVMEFVEGTDVAQLIASEGRLEPARAVPIITAVCEALAFAHEEGIIHRDIKPSNVMIDRRGRVKVADFGLAKTINVESTLITRSDVAMGTPDFLAPEAMSPGTKVDGRADIYAVGVMLYQMLTGQIPRGRFALPSALLPQVDRGFDDIVDKAMQTDRDKRYSTATHMRRDVEKVAASAASVAESIAAVTSTITPPPATPAPAPKKPKAAMLLIATVGALAALAGGKLLLKPGAGTSTGNTPSAPALAPGGGSNSASAAGIPGSERSAAERVLGKGYSLLVQTAAGQSLKVATASALPAGDFSVLEIENQTRNSLDDADMAALAGLPKLQKIKLYQTQVTGQGLRLLATLPSLAYLTLDWNKQLKDEDLQVLQSCPRLRSLTLRHPEQLTSAVLRFLPAAPGLEKLELVDFPLREEDISLICQQKSLQFLDLSGTPLPAAALEALHQLPDLAELRFVMPSDGRSVNFARFPKLKRAGVTNGISTSVVKDLAANGQMEQLVIHVPGKLTQKGLEEEVIREIAWSLKGLNTLSLGLDYPLSGTAQLSPLAALPKLKTLSVAFHGAVNTFDDAALLSLEKVASLRTIILSATMHRVTREGLAEFQKRRPDVKIEGPGAAGASVPAAASVSASISTSVASTSAHSDSAKTFPPGQWTKVWQKPEDIPDVDEAKITEGWALMAGGHLKTPIPGFVAWNGGLRARFRYHESEPHAQLRLRDRDGKGWNVIIGYGAIHFRTHDLRQSPDYQNQWKQATLLPKEGEEYLLEFVAIGQTLHGRLNGHGFSFDMGGKSGQAMPGGMHLLQTHFNPFRDVEVINLDGLGEAEARKAAGVDLQPQPAPGMAAFPLKQGEVVSYPPGRWTRWWTAEEEKERTVKSDGPWLLLRDANHGRGLSSMVAPMSNMGLRAQFRGRRVKEDVYPQINMRSGEPGSVNLAISPDGRKAAIRLATQGKISFLKEVPLREPLLPDKEYTMEFYVVGTTLVARVDGQELTAQTPQEGTPKEGHFGIYYANGDFLRNVELLNLDGLREADAFECVNARR